ncbi:ribosome recycling factor family protein [Vibrio sp. AND4]|uniref:ribosome recycling factor family protein n=1 Tax=Vibrio sp. AND4 TaxID=314289 RepID=UPI00015F3483|nr:ribosome recycling factor family protein [Vibrio sp. AND4]EDP59584.1 hypothetical protein AND4_10519 [Vibrio sp. AND4]
MTDSLISIPLPSLIHRIGGEHAKRAKIIAAQCKCQLKRIRRSRNWKIEGNALDIKAFLDLVRLQEAEGLHFVIQRLEIGLTKHSDKLEPLETKLIRLVCENPAITLAELMAETNCSLVQARTARFDAENL